MSVGWEYAMLRVYSHFPEENMEAEKLWALQTRAGIEHGEVVIDELELFNDLGAVGWRIRFKSAGSGMPHSKLLDRYFYETVTGRVIGTDEWLLERARQMCGDPDPTLVMHRLATSTESLKWGRGSAGQRRQRRPVRRCWRQGVAQGQGVWSA